MTYVLIKVKPVRAQNVVILNIIIIGGFFEMRDCNFYYKPSYFIWCQFYSDLNVFKY